MNTVTLLTFLLEHLDEVVISYVLLSASLCVALLCWRWKYIWLPTVVGCFVLQGLLWWPRPTESEEASAVMASSKRAIDLKGHEVPREHWCFPKDYKHDFKNGPALHLEPEDYWKPELSHQFCGKKQTFYFVKDESGAKITSTFGERPKQYYVDESGKAVFGRTFAFAEPFSEGLAAVSNESVPRPLQGNNNFPIKHFINRAGKTAFPGKFEEVSQFHCGRAVVLPCVVSSTHSKDGNNSTKNIHFSYDNQKQLPICIDARGRKVFGGNFTWIGPFSDGCAPVFTEGNPDGTGLVDTNGKFLVRRMNFTNFAEGLGAFKDPKTGLYGYADRQGRIQIPAQFHHADKFSEGFAVVGLKRTVRVPKWQLKTFLLIQDSERIPHSQRGNREFDGQLTAAYIDRQGKFLNIKLMEPKNDIMWAEPFRHGIAYVDLYPEREVQTDLAIDEGLESAHFEFP